MTLLIGTISKRHIVITADGLSRVNPTTGEGISSETFQKVFPITGVPIAFAHHGLNILMGKSIGEFIGDYIRQYGTRISTASIKEIAEDLRSYTAEPAETILADPSNKGVIGFWIAGFCPGKGKPELYEICWPDNPSPYKHETIVLGGDAKQFVVSYLDQPLGKFPPNSIWQSSVDFVCQYHQALYKKANDKQNATSQIIFGGHQHQLVLEKSGWNWTIPPR
jgi:hypothetical protein